MGWNARATFVLGKEIRGVSSTDCDFADSDWAAVHVDQVYRDW